MNSLNGNVKEKYCMVGVEGFLYYINNEPKVKMKKKKMLVHLLVLAAK